MWNRKVWPLLWVSVWACGGGETRPDRSGWDSAAGSGGGSNTNTSVELPSCNALCVWEVSVSGDCPADATEQCQAAFRVGVMGLGPDEIETCVAVLETWCQCLLDSTDPDVVSCTGGAVTSNIPVINGVPETCNDETDEWIECNR